MTKTKKQKIILLTLTAFMCLIAFLFSSVGYTPKVFADGGEDEVQTDYVTGYTPYVFNLCKGINVIDAESLMAFKEKRILDEGSIGSLNIRWENVSDDSETEETTSSSYTYEDMLAKFNPTIRASLSVGSFISMAERQLTNESNLNYSSYNYKYYKNVYQNIRRYKLYIANRDQEVSFVLSQTFKDDLAKLQNGTMTYVQFFSDYGTHLSTSAIYGGTLQMNYTLASNVVTIDSSASSVIDECVSLPIEQGVMLDIVTSLNTAYNKNYTESNFQSSSYCNVTGGETFSILDTDFQEKYNEWVDSFDPVNTEDFHVNLTYDIVEYSDGGLKPLWEILPGDYANVATDMQNAFIELSAGKKQAFEDKFKTGNYAQYSGGFGTETNPFILTNIDDLINIRLNMSSHYVMANDIDISSHTDWWPIGGYYAASPFTGTFDGCGYNINGLKRTAALPISNNRSYFGFFGCISTGGVFKNVNFTNVAIGIGVDTYDKNDRVFTGVACGYLYNARIENVTTVSGHIANSNNCKGVVFVGGIIGLARISTIEQCTNNLEVIGGRYSGVAGGVAGYGYDVDFINCTNNGHVKAYGARIGGCAYAGGILGEKYDSAALDCTFVNCVHNGSLTATKAWGYTAKIDALKANLCPHATSKIYGG